MFSLKAQQRNIRGRQVASLRQKGIVPAVLYGPDIKGMVLEVSEKEVEKAFKEAGESSLIKLEADKPYEVLIHQVARSPLTSGIVHIDFYCPSVKKEIEAEVPLSFKGEAPAVKNLGGILVKEIHQVKVKGLVKDLPREIVVDVSKLEGLEDRIFIRDLQIPKGVRILKHHKDDIVALVVPPRVEKEEKKEKAAVETVAVQKTEGKEQGAGDKVSASKKAP